VPSEPALQAPAELAPLVELGAGTGYWSAVLRQRGMGVVAYDRDPPSDSLSNIFFKAFAFTEVLKGDGATLFAQHPEPELARRALLLVWPNNPDHLDKPAYASAGPYTVWDIERMQAYMAAGGQTVVYVGERQSEIRVVDGAPPDCGVTGSRRFQAMLAAHFEMSRQVAIPQWFPNVDDLTVWRRK
jgi:hypothetical protein